MKDKYSKHHYIPYILYKIPFVHWQMGKTVT